MDPEGKIIVVTGASGGIGGELVRALVERDARRVIACDIVPDGVQALSAELGEERVVARTLDVSDEAATQTLIAEVEESVGPIDVFFANAGIATGGGAEAPNETWERQWHINVMAHVYAARALLPGWIERGEGHLITTASMAGILATLGDGVYTSTKHAALGFAEWLAITHAAEGVKVSCICPGAVNTGMLRAGADGDADKAAAVIGGGNVLAPDVAVERILSELTDDRFLILTHPEMQEFIEQKATNRDRWIRGMSRLWARSQALLAGGQSD
jgi:NAD(P)-dependent dehydrogenase (short-subunit alcohol dehydrogenase family)